MLDWKIKCAYCGQQWEIEKGQDKMFLDSEGASVQCLLPPTL